MKSLPVKKSKVEMQLAVKTHFVVSERQNTLNTGMTKKQHKFSALRRIVKEESKILK